MRIYCNISGNTLSGACYNTLSGARYDRLYGTCHDRLYGTVALFLRRITISMAIAVPAIMVHSATTVAAPDTAEQVARTPASTRYYIANGDYLNVKISPDGQHLAASMRSKDTYAIVFMRTDDFAVVGGMKTADREIIGDFHWVNNDRLLFEIAEFRGGYELPSGTGELWAVDRDGSDVKLLTGWRAQDAQRGSRIKTRERAFSTFTLLSTLPNDPRNVLVLEYPWELRGNTFYDTRSTFPIVAKLNVRSAKLRKLQTLPHRGADVFADAAGQLRFLRWVSNDAKTHSAYREANDKPWQDAATLANVDTAPAVHGIDLSTNQIFLMIAAGEGQHDSMIVVDPATGNTRTLVEPQRSNITHVFYDPQTSLPIAAVSQAGGPQYHYFDRQHPLVRLHRGLAKAFAGQLVDIAHSDRRGNLHVIRVASDVNPGEFYLYDSRTREARFVLANRSWMDVQKLAPKISITVTARDGLQIPALLTLPKGSPQAKFPLIVYSHGGPHGVRSPWLFEEDVQLLAARGFAVLQVNHRGSGGYGQRFLKLGYRQWGGAIIDDIEDVVASVFAEYGDRLGRACSYGASFGGYASLVLATRNPEWLACSAGFAGVYDLTVDYEKGDIPTLPYGVSYLEKAIGRDPGQLKAFSPVYHADGINVPVLLIHGGRDRRVPSYHATVMRDALAKAGKQVDFVFDPTMGHGIFSEAKRAAHWDRLINFFRENLADSEHCASCADPQ